MHHKASDLEFQVRSYYQAKDFLPFVKDRFR